MEGSGKGPNGVDARWISAHRSQLVTSRNMGFDGELGYHKRLKNEERGNE